MRSTRSAGSDGARWPLALAAALAVARAGVVALRPNDGLIEPDPVDAREFFSADDIARARRFGRPQLALHAASAAVQAGVLAALVARPPQPRLQRPLLEASLAGGALSGLVGLAPLPLGALARRRALAVGLATQPWSGWARDVAKASAIEMATSAAVSPAAIALMRRLPRTWWLPGAGVLVIGAAGMTLLAPIATDPLFNRFTPLPDGPEREDVLMLAARAGVSVGEVYAVDASRRTTAANAYVTGLGPTKRVVLFDTLLRDFTEAETRLVVAHELGHVRHRDVARGIAHLGLTAPAGMGAVALLTRRLQGAKADRASAATLPALALSLGIVAGAIGSVSSALSRRVEARADAFALDLAGASEPFIAFERRIVKQNLADPDPPRWLTLLLASHPPTVERIGIARAYARGATASPRRRVRSRRTRAGS